jgi:hypothetical protein
MPHRINSRRSLFNNRKSTQATPARNLDRANVLRTVAKQLMGHRTDQKTERYAFTTSLAYPFDLINSWNGG